MSGFNEYLLGSHGEINQLLVTETSEEWVTTDQFNWNHFLLLKI
jgi:hypothetical protein